MLADENRLLDPMAEQSVVERGDRLVDVVFDVAREAEQIGLVGLKVRLDGWTSSAQ
jgi:hypothetical protein